MAGLNQAQTKLALALKSLEEFDEDTSYQRALMQDRHNRGPSIMSAIPVNIMSLWVKRDALNAQIFKEIRVKKKAITDQLKAIDDPLYAIGRTIKKKSNKPFKGGESTVTVNGIIAHPYIDGFAFKYVYFDKQRCDTFESYVAVNSVEIDYSNFEV